MQKQMVDYTFGISKQVLAVAAYLVGLEEYLPVPARVRFRMSPWYNGREKGICWEIGTTSGPVLCLAVYGDRIDGDLCAFAWNLEFFSLNPPTFRNAGDHLPPFRVPDTEAANMADWIRQQVSQFFDFPSHGQRHQ
jgi:hypothetical protein